MVFKGQFVYFGQLVEYNSAIGSGSSGEQANGLVKYSVKENKKSNYENKYNIYDYDNEKYINYVKKTFDLNFLDGIRLIPGINQEQFELVSDYLTEIQSIAGLVVDQMLLYEDPSLYDTENANQMEDFWAKIVLEKNQVLSLNNGSIEIKILPEPPLGQSFWKKIAIGLGVILCVAIVATIVVSIPGVGCIVTSIAIGALKGAVIGAISGFAFGFVIGGVGAIFEGLINGHVDWGNVFSKAMNSAADGFMTGAITGAIMGGISGGLNPKACFEAGTTVATVAGAVAIQNIVAGDKVWSYNSATKTNELKTVVSTSVKTADKFIKIKAGEETITSTPEHLYYVVGKGYVVAEFLRAGDRLQLLNGEIVIVEQIQHEILESLVAVYNFEVEDNHSYFVGNSSVLVHNAGCGSANPKVKQAANNGRNVHADTYFGYDKSLVNSKTAGMFKEHTFETVKNGKIVKYKADFYVDYTKNPSLKIGNFKGKLIELKPDNAKAITRGINQLKNYDAALGGGNIKEIWVYGKDNIARPLMTILSKN
jgi:hypothetical protein